MRGCDAVVSNYVSNYVNLTGGLTTSQDSTASVDEPSEREDADANGDLWSNSLSRCAVSAVLMMMFQEDSNIGCEL